MTNLTIGFDLDGVLADFIQAYTTVGNKLYGIPIVREIEEESPNYGNRERFGISPEQDDRIWEEITNTFGFWCRLEPMVDWTVFDRINQLQKEHQVHFITARAEVHGWPVQAQSANWLSYHGIQHPSVINTHRKGRVCNALGVDIMIDDKLDTVINIMQGGPTKAYVIDRAHNRGPRAEGVRRVYTVEGYLKEIAELSFLKKGIDPYHGEK